MFNTEKLVDAAIDYRVAMLRAEEQGIIHVVDCGGDKEKFLIYDTDDFREIIKTREYTITEREGDYRYEYKTKVAGLTFICLTSFLFEEEDTKYIVTEEESK
jgi:hypothetical protein